MLLTPLLNVSLYLNQCIDSIIYGSFGQKTYVNILERGYLRTNHPVFMNYWDDQLNSSRSIGVKFPTPPDTVLVDLDKIDLAEYFDRLFDTGFIKQRALHIFFGSGQDTFKKVLKTLHSFFITRVIYYDIQTGTISTVLSYRRKNILEFDTAISHVGKCDSDKNWRILSQISNNHYLASFWEGWTIHVCHIRKKSKCDDRGLEYEFISFILNTLKVKIKYICPVEKFKKKQMVVKHKCDILYRMYQKQNDRSSDLTDIYIFDTFSWYVPEPALVPVKMFPIKVFSYILWMILCVTVILISLIWAVMNGVFRRFRVNFFFTYPVKVLISLIEQSFYIEKRIFFGEAIVIICILYLTFIMNVAYKSRFFYLLTGKEYSKSAITYTQIKKFQVKLIAPYEDLPKAFIKETKYPLEDCQTSILCFNQSVSTGDVAILTLDEKAKKDVSLFLDSEGRSLFHRLEPPDFGSRIACLLPKGHPFLYIFNRHLSYISEFGFHRKIREGYERRVRFKFVQESNKIRKLSIQHLEAPLNLLVLGVILSTFLFIMEYLLHAYNPK